MWHTDNYGAVCIIRKGSNKSHLQNLSENIFNICTDNSILFNIKWIPRMFISFADMLSKQIDHDDWETTKGLFRFLDKKWGPFTIDRFADNHNTKTGRFYSKFLCPDTEGVNAFHFSWFGENNYLVPPVYLVPYVLKHMKYYRAKGTLVIPNDVI